MKYTLLILTFVGLSFIGFNCSNKVPISKLFNNDNLPTTVLTIDTQKDTLIQTPRGTLIKIPAGAITTQKGSEVKLELKEAFSIREMVNGGLFTQSNGEALSSGGMFYINAAAGQEVTITQKIKIAIPTAFTETKMQLYKGEIKDNGSVNWTNPVPLSNNGIVESLDTGRVLFAQKCASCHNIGKALTGPDLAHLSKRFPIGEQNDRYYFHLLDQPRPATTDSTHDYLPDFDHAYDIYKCNLIRNFSTVGIKFPDLDGKTYLSIIKYIQNESDKRNLPLPPQNILKNCADSCEAYKAKANKLQNLKTISEAEREKYIKENGTLTEIINSNQNVPENITTTPVFSDFDEMVSPENFSATYYQFSIETFGWYNIDVLLKDIDGVKESSLFASITGEWRERVEIYLIIPERKIFVQGGKADNIPDAYAFLYKNGTINLPQNARAYILAVSEANDKIAFGLKEFTTTTQQQIDISLTQSSKKSLNTALNILNSSDFKVNVSNAKNAAEIKVADAKIESINRQLNALDKEKPVNCDCNCGVSPAEQPAVIQIDIPQ